MAVYQPAPEGGAALPQVAILVAVVLVVATIYPLLPIGLGIHAAPGRGRPALHAHHHAGPLHHRGQKYPAADRPHHPDLSRRWRRSSARPAGPKPPLTRRRSTCSRPPSASRTERLAAGHDHRSLIGEMDDAVKFPGPGQFLGLSHQDPHRHALHRHQDPGGPQIPGPDLDVLNRLAAGRRPS